MSATCHRCDDPMPRGWFFVMLCDPCLSEALDQKRAAPEAVEVVVVGDAELADPEPHASS